MSKLCKEFCYFLNRVDLKKIYLVCINKKSVLTRNFYFYHGNKDHVLKLYVASRLLKKGVIKSNPNIC